MCARNTCAFHYVVFEANMLTELARKDLGQDETCPNNVSSALEFILKCF